MQRVFGIKKDKEPSPSVQDASQRINKRGDIVDEKLKKLDAELIRYREQIKKTRPGPAQEAIKARAMRVLKQKRVYEGQRDMLYSRTFNLDQVASASEGLKDAQETRGRVQDNSGEAFSVLLSELAAYLMRDVSPEICQQEIDNLQGEMMDLMDVTKSKVACAEANVPDHMDEMKSWVVEEPNFDAELGLPQASAGNTTSTGRSNALVGGSWMEHALCKHIVQKPDLLMSV